MSDLTDADTIEVRYSCDLCGLVDVRLSVPARRTEEVSTWMDATIRLLARDHARRSYGCHPTELTRLMIPTTGRPIIGGSVVE